MDEVVGSIPTSSTNLPFSGFRSSRGGVNAPPMLDIHLRDISKDVTSAWESTPTMRVRAEISDTVNVYLAFRAALIALFAHNRAGSPIRTLLVAKRPTLARSCADMASC